MRKFMCLAVCAVICFSIAACSKKEPSSASPESTSEVQVQSSEAYIYVGRGEAYTSYAVAYDGELTADVIVKKLAEVTGWNLDVDSISDENGKISIDFSEESAVYTGDYGDAYGEFLIGDRDDLVCTILDSVLHTLNQNLAADGELSVSYSCGGYPIKVNGNVLEPEDGYNYGDANLYSAEQAEEFLVHQLSNYYDTPDTIYEKYGEQFEAGELFYIYRATEKKSGELMGVYKFPAGLNELYEEVANGDYELIWSMDSFAPLDD